MLNLIFRKRHPAVGARPGTLMIPDQAPPPKIRMIRYSETELTETDVDTVDHLRDALSDDGKTWIDVQGFGDRSQMEQIGQLFDLHPLLLEDVVNAPQRPKTEAYGDQILLIVRMVSVDSEGRVAIEQVSIVFTARYVLTFQERYGDILDPVRRRIRSGKGSMRKLGADYLAYAVADTIIDGYYPVLELIGTHLEKMEEIVIARPSPQVLSDLHTLKNQLINLRRCIWPQRDAINRLIRDDHATVSEDVRVFLRDTYDHCVQTSEVAEMYREMVTGLMNLYLSSIANRTNEVMKVLTIMASIFIPLTFMAGIYGMNFQYMPELQVWWAYPLIWLTMFGVAAGMLIYFWRKGWIGTQPPDATGS